MSDVKNFDRAERILDAAHWQHGLEIALFDQIDGALVNDKRLDHSVNAIAMSMTQCRSAITHVADEMIQDHKNGASAPQPALSRLRKCIECLKASP